MLKAPLDFTQILAQVPQLLAGFLELRPQFDTLPFGQRSAGAVELDRLAIISASNRIVWCDRALNRRRSGTDAESGYGQYDASKHNMHLNLTKKRNHQRNRSTRTEHN
jgi:hypothetical protein